MVMPESPTTTTAVVAEFTSAPREHLDTVHQALIDAVWHAGRATGAALGVAGELVDLFADLDPDRQGRAAVVLGLLVDTEYPRSPGELTAAVAAGVDTYLAAWRATTKDQPLSLALLYLLGHFPEARDQVLDVAIDVGVDDDDLSRLERAVQRLDPERPDLGRAFPYPAAWELDDTERDFDRGWITGLTPQQVRAHWDNDTETVLGHAGAKAYWAVRNGTPTPVLVDAVPPRDPGPLPTDAGGFDRHGAAFRCPSCGQGLEFGDAAARCRGCANAYALDGGIVDFTTTIGDGHDRGADFLFKLAEMPSMGFFYEAYARPNFLRLCGSNWAAQVLPSDEDAYIAEHVRPVDGPVLDLAAGAGRWTAALANAVGAQRVVALDLGLPMLTTLRARLPEIPAVLSSGRTLPFADGSLGAVLCWNALQAFPDDAPAVIAEVGRCLRPGGTFTLLTFRNAPDPVYRHFVWRHHFPQHADGLRLFDYADLRAWLSAAGLRVRHEWRPGTFVVITAQREN
ncbi:class I SAM-dependent methyltransferase [Actinokineospora diospyrosa]|uniref:Methyltransferase domain-containing protein n=1 Tax=Actinokineospora diospyrosa TaxID=103728 RepID=A0ABT1IF71_9PSEU|nr:class I SAM-dependent methyltransferase [Actinokineospora diospyrosa]MCP2270946.1 Methyltransferase domain-containing protein [Actinokineospora diospyrosa]